MKRVRIWLREGGFQSITSEAMGVSVVDGILSVVTFDSDFCFAAGHWDKYIFGDVIEESEDA